MDILRLRILMLTPQLPFPPRQGTSIRNYNLIRELSHRHQVDLLTFLAPGDSLSTDSPLYEHCDHVQSVAQPNRSARARLRDTLLSTQPDMGLRLLSQEMLDVVGAIDLAGYDIIQFEGIEMAPYGLHIASRRRGARPKIVFDNHNCEYLLQKRNAQTDLRSPRRWPAAGYSLIQTQKLRAYERRACNASDLVIAVSEPDKTALLELNVTTRIVTVSNGIDADAYAMSEIPSEPITPGADQAANIVFTGKMDYRPNIDAALWFGNQVFPMIQSALADDAFQTVFQIVGQQPHARLDPLRSHAHVDITGAVPEIQPYLASASVFVIPMRVGGGTRLKALEAMAAGLPIVTTSLGIEGISVRDGQELIIRDTPADFADAVVELIRDQRSGGRQSAALGSAARAFVTDLYDWSAVVPRLESAYEGLL